ncbi:MAG: DNA cytosine methyltransferase [Sphingobacteriaceae bacterium]|nr:MAG: DNA cytosine methyltransferase [Sphingobacteriaceae bacterium]
MSCDLLASDTPGPHYQGDVFDIIDDGFDLMIAHPPCTYLCSSGLHWNNRRPEKALETEKAIEFVQSLMSANIPKIALENPIGCLSTRYRKPDCIIQPFQHGHPESKATCLWLKNLPVLQPTNTITKPANGRWNNQTASGQNNLGPSKDRWKIRSTTYQGIANAMADQWGEVQELY